jgi:signal peptidase I
MASTAKIVRVTSGVLLNVLVMSAFLIAGGFVAAGVLGYDRYVIMSGSMTGTYDVGSIVFDEQVPARDLAVGDVITYQPPASSGLSNLVTHRISSIKQDKDGQVAYRTKGDANPQVDPWKFSLDSDVQARVEFSVPYAGYIFIGLADRPIRMLVIGTPAALLALYSLLEVVSALRGRKSAAEPAGISGTAVPST